MTTKINLMNLLGNLHLNLHVNPPRQLFLKTTRITIIDNCVDGFNIK